MIRMNSLVSFLQLRAWYIGFFTASGHIPFLAIFCILLATKPVPSAIGLLIGIIWVWAFQAYGFLINDLFDLPFDKAAGKPTPIDRFPRWVILLSLTLLMFVGILPVVYRPSSLLGVLVLLAYLLATAYSAPKLRLKERGVWGFLADSVMGRPLPVLVLFALLSKVDSVAVLFALLAGLFSLMTILKQHIDDYEGDLRSNNRTVVVQFGKRNSDLLLRRAFYPADLISIAGFSVLIGYIAPASIVDIAFAWILVAAVGALLLSTRFLSRNLLKKTVADFTVLSGILYHSKDLPFMISFINVNFEGLITLVLGLGLALVDSSYYVLVALYVVSQYYYSGFYKILANHFLKVISLLQSSRRRGSGES